MKKFISHLARLASTVIAALALVVAPLAVSAADAAVLPSSVTGITLSPSVVQSGEQYTLTVSGLGVGEQTTWDGAYYYSFSLEGSTIVEGSCSDGRTLLQSDSGQDTNFYANNIRIFVALYPSGTSCIDGATPPVSTPQFSSEIQLLPVLSVPTVQLTEGVDVASVPVAFSLATALATPEWPTGGTMTVVPDDLCIGGLIPVTLPQPNTPPAGLSFQPSNELVSGQAPALSITGTPEAGTAGTYAYCIKVTDGPQFSCTSAVVSTCAMRPDSVATYAWFTLTIAPALASTGAPSQSSGLWLGIVAGVILVLGIGFLVGRQIYRRRK